MQPRRGHQYAERFGATGVERERLAKGVRNLRPRFARDQRGGGDVPFVAPAQRCDEIGLTSGDHRNPERDRIGTIDRGKIAIEDRKSVVSGKSLSVRVHLGGRRIIKKTITYLHTQPSYCHYQPKPYSQPNTISPTLMSYILHTLPNTTHS